MHTQYLANAELWMSVKHSLLALLAEEPTHGYQLKSSFEQRTGGAWPLNIGQVYTTLSRLERDGLVAEVDRDGDRVTYRITDAGRSMLDAWYAAPIITDPPPRDELAIKLLLGVAADDVDVVDLLQRQRTATLEQLQRYTLHKRRADPATELPFVLLLDSLILKAEAEIRWLDLCEQRLASRAR
jgi:DNA-binding PadR family transcriptional regulator